LDGVDQMPKFSVTIEYVITNLASIEIDAESELEAHEKAEAMICTSSCTPTLENLNWGKPDAPLYNIVYDRGIKSPCAREKEMRKQYRKERKNYDDMN
jgi:hypothetical protein